MLNCSVKQSCGPGGTNYLGNRKECPNNWEESEYLLEEPHQYEMFRYFEERAATADFDVRSLLPEFQACQQFPLVFDHDPHWNSAGHQFVAETLSELLVDELGVFKQAASRSSSVGGLVYGFSQVGQLKQSRRNITGTYRH